MSVNSGIDFDNHVSPGQTYYSFYPKIKCFVFVNYLHNYCLFKIQFYLKNDCSSSHFVKILQSAQISVLTFEESPNIKFPGFSACIHINFSPHPKPCLYAQGIRFFYNCQSCFNLTLVISPIILIFSKVQSPPNFAPLSFFNQSSRVHLEQSAPHIIIFRTSSLPRRHGKTFQCSLLPIQTFSHAFGEGAFTALLILIFLEFPLSNHRPGRRSSVRGLFFPRSPFNIFARQRKYSPARRASIDLFNKRLIIVKSAPATGRDSMPILYRFPSLLPGSRTSSFTYFDTSNTDWKEWKGSDSAGKTQKQLSPAIASVPVQFLKLVQIEGCPESLFFNRLSFIDLKIPGSLLSCYIYLCLEFHLKIHRRKGPVKLFKRTSLICIFVSFIIARTFATLLLITILSKPWRNLKWPWL